MNSTLEIALIATVVLLLFLGGCSSLDVGVSIRDIDEDHITECQISDNVLSNKECVVEITVEYPL